MAYIKQRNIADADEIIKITKRDYESDIMRSVKTHPKRFYSFVRERQVKAKVTNLDLGDGNYNFTINDSESCQV